MAQKALIRPARLGEEEAIHNAHMRSIREVCVKDHGKEEIKGWGFRPVGDRWTESIKSGLVWVVEKEGSVKGVAGLSIDKEAHSACIQALYLTPEALGEGLGKELAEIMIAKATEEGAKIIHLDSSITAHSFYQKLGFEDEGPRKKVNIGGHPVTCFPMQKRL